MVIGTTICIVIVYFLSFLLIIGHYNQTEPSLINTFRAGWLCFIMSSLLLLVLIPTLVEQKKNDFDKQIKINSNITAEELYKKGYIIISQSPNDKTLYNVREIIRHETPIEEIK